MVGKRNVVEKSKLKTRVAHLGPVVCTSCLCLAGNIAGWEILVVVLSGLLGPGGAVQRTVDAQLGVTNNLPDGTLLLEVVQGLASERTVDLETIDKGGDCDEAVGLDVLVELVRGLLVEDDGVLGLVLDYGTR